MNVGAAMDLRFDASLSEFADYVTGLGLDHVELKREYLAAHPDAPTPREVREVADAYDLTVTYHAPFRDWNVGSFDETVCRQSVERVRHTLDDANAAGAVGVVVHGGSVPRRYPERVRAQARHNACESLRACAAYADDVGVPLCIENQPPSDRVERQTVTPDDLAALVDALDFPPETLKVTVDVGHAKVSGVAPEAFADRFSDRLHVVHLHDNDGARDQHAPLPDYEAVAASLGAPYNVLEMKAVDDVRHSVRTSA